MDFKEALMKAFLVLDAAADITGSFEMYQASGDYNLLSNTVYKYYPEATTGVEPMFNIIRISSNLASMYERFQQGEVKAPELAKAIEESFISTANDFNRLLDEWNQPGDQESDQELV